MAMHNPRPWVTPQEVKDFSERESVKNRSDERLIIDIFRAENYVIAYTRNRFDNPERFPEIPKAVRIAVIMLAEHYAVSSTPSADGSNADGRFKSERFDDYSYTLADGGELIDRLDLGPLLDEYICREEVRPNTVMRMRRL